MEIPMGNGARGRQLRAVTALVAASAVIATAGCSGGGDDGEVTIEFAQWWAPELPDGAFQELIDQFEDENPGVHVELISQPWAATQEQLVAGAASGTMPDVMGLDGVWVNDLAQQGAIADLSALMDEHGYDDGLLAGTVDVDDATYMIQVVNFIYPLFTNDALLAEAGIDAPPTTREEFVAAAAAVAELGGDVSGWAAPLSLEQPNGALNDIMPWVWAAGGSMLADGQPDVTNDDMAEAWTFVQDLWDSGSMTAGAFTMREPDKVEEFANGRVGMMFSSLAHINLLQTDHPELEFSVSAVPTPEGYEGDSGITTASWGIGVASGSEHPDEAWQLVEFLMDTDVNSQLSTIANGFPGNTDSVPDFVEDDPLMADAFEIYQASTPTNEFSGLPAAEQLQREFVTELQGVLDGDQSVDEGLESLQTSWSDEF